MWDQTEADGIPFSMRHYSFPMLHISESQYVTL